MTWTAGYAPETEFTTDHAVEHSSWEGARGFVARELVKRLQALQESPPFETKSESIHLLSEHLRMLEQCEPDKDFMIQLEGRIFYVIEDPCKP